MLQDHQPAFNQVQGEMIDRFDLSRFSSDVILLLNLGQHNFSGC